MTNPSVKKCPPNVGHLSLGLVFFEKPLASFSINIEPISLIISRHTKLPNQRRSVEEREMLTPTRTDTSDVSIIRPPRLWEPQNIPSKVPTIVRYSQLVYCEGDQYNLW